MTSGWSLPLHSPAAPPISSLRSCDLQPLMATPPTHTGPSRREWRAALCWSLRRSRSPGSSLLPPAGGAAPCWWLVQLAPCCPLLVAGGAAPCCPLLVEQRQQQNPGRETRPASRLTRQQQVHRVTQILTKNKRTVKQRPTATKGSSPRVTAELCTNQDFTVVCCVISQ